MRNLMLALGAASLVIPVTMAVPTGKAEARKHYSVLANGVAAMVAPIAVATTARPA